MNADLPHKHQAVIDYINENGKRSKPVKAGYDPYKMLKALADAHGINMNGAKQQVLGLNHITNRALNKRVQLVLDDFCCTGKLTLPSLFNARRGGTRNKKSSPQADRNGSLYIHDRDETANRNLWAQSASLKKNKSKMLKEGESHKGTCSNKALKKKGKITNPRELAVTLAQKHKSGEIVLGKRAILTVATVLDKKATIGQVRVMVKEAEKHGIKILFRTHLDRYCLS